jgi:hypothetical protein
LRPEFFPAPVPIAVAVPADRSLLRFKVALLRSMLRYVSRKLLILKQCYMLRFFENECESPRGQRKADSAICGIGYSRKATHTILQKI